MTRKVLSRRVRLALSGRFLRGFLATLSFDALARICGAASAVILLRALRVTEYAYLVVFLAVAQTLTTASTGGIRLGYLRREAERVSRGLERTPVFLPVAAVGALLLAVFCVGGWMLSQALSMGPDRGSRVAFWGCVFMY